MKKLSNFRRFLKRRFSAPAAASLASFIEVERAEQIFYLNYLRDGMTIFDVGANIGELTLLFSRFAGSAGKVHSFEPSGVAFGKLQLICQTVDRSNIVLNRLALAEKKGSIALHVYDDAYLPFNSQAVREIKEGGMTVEPVAVEEAPATTVDRYCAENRIEKIDLLKIDVEGAELQVLAGAGKMLASQSIECITFEFGQTTYDMGNSAEKIENLLTEASYEIRNIIEGQPVFPGRENPQNVYAMHVAAPFRK